MTETTTTATELRVADATSQSSHVPLPLEDRLYDLSDDELEFYRKETGMEDADAIKEHILRVQAEAYAVHALAQTFLSRKNLTTNT